METQIYTAYVGYVAAHLIALQRAGFSIMEIAKMTKTEKIELGRMALEDEGGN